VSLGGGRAWNPSGLRFSRDASALNSSHRRGVEVRPVAIDHAAPDLPAKRKVIGQSTMHRAAFIPNGQVAWTPGPAALKVWLLDMLGNQAQDRVALVGRQAVDSAHELSATEDRALAGLRVCSNHRMVDATHLSTDMRTGRSEFELMAGHRWASSHLNVRLLALIFIPLERSFTGRTQPHVREEFRLDILYFIAEYLVFLPLVLEFDQIGFAVREGVRCSYAVAVEGDSYAVEAICDFDGDGQASAFGFVKSGSSAEIGIAGPFGRCSAKGVFNPGDPENPMLETVGPCGPIDRWN
jgi:hypothetical protein